MGLQDSRGERARVLAAFVCVLGGVMGAPAIAQVRAAALPADAFGRAGTVKVRVSRDTEAPTQGRLVADYGGFAEYEVNAGAALPAGAETLENENIVLLNARRLDTTQDAVKGLRVARGAFQGKAMHLVQFAGPIKREWYDRLERTGVEIVTYLPSNAYLVYGDAASIGALQAWGAADAVVQWDGEYLAEYRIDPAAAKMMADPAKGVATDQMFAIQLVKDEAANRATLAQIDAVRAGAVVNDWEILNYRNVIAPIPAALLPAIAAMPDVVSIQPWETKRHWCERADQIIAGNISGNTPTGPGYLAWLGTQGFTQAQFTASNFVVDVSDSGVDNGTTNPNHFGLFTGGAFASGSRVAYNRLVGTAHSGSTLSGCDGHGNLNSHIIAGYDNTSGTPFADASGYHFGLGVCPFVKVGSSVIFDPNTFTSPNYSTLQSQAYASGARVSSNSWGGSSNGYSVDSQSYDTLVRDAQSGTTGNQEMVIVFAAGNNGTAGANTVSEPSTAKNVITVGAGENVQAIGGSDASGISDTGANSANDMATFSGRGPTSDGRHKPDICAPGTHVSGGVAQASQLATGTGAKLACYTGSGVSGGASSIYFPNAGQQFYTASSGTSHSTPCVAGGCALVRQYFINQGWAVPSAAMTKAVLMNSARYMTGTGAGDTLWSNAQGMGEMNLGEAFKRGTSTQSILRDELAVDLFTATGQTRTFTGTIADTTKPFRVTVVWSDAPGATSGAAYKNNLDLTVTIGANTYKGNVFSGAASVTGGSADTVNNAESVFLPAGTSGSFTVTITATNINSDGVPGNADTTDQDFALVVYNGTTGCTGPTVSGNTSPQTVCEGSPASFTVSATGGSLTYQWRKNTQNIAGATASTYTIASTATGDTGSYDCLVGSSCGSIISSASALTVNAGTVISGSPSPQTACEGASAGFAVSATGTNLAYQWRKNGNPISGATGTSLSFASVAAGDAGSYDCVVTGGCGTQTSGAAGLTVYQATAVTVQPPALKSACTGGNVTFSITAVGGNLAYQWRKNGSVIAGATSPSYTIQGVATTDAANYYCQVTGDCGQAFSDLSLLVVNETSSIAPGGQPASRTLCEGQPLSLSVVVNGSPDSYQWRKNTVAIPGATGDTYSIASPTAADSGVYDCVIVDPCTGITSSGANVVVNPTTAISPGGQPQPQTACVGGTATFSVTAVGGSLTYQWRKGGQPIGGATQPIYRINPVGAADQGSYDCVVVGACGTTTSGAASLAVTPATSITGNPSAQSACVGGSATFSVTAGGSGLTYQWRRGGTPLGGATSPTLTLNPIVSGDAGSYDCVVTGDCGSATSSAAELTLDGALAIGTQPQDQSLCAGGTISLSMSASGGVTGYQWRKGGNDLPGATGATLTIATAATTDSGGYDCVVTGPCGTVTTREAAVAVCGAVSITGSPLAASTCRGGTASMSVAADGGGLAYQWRKGGVPISGATAATIGFAPASVSDSGLYDCVVSNCCDSQTSAAARLSVCAADYNCNGVLAVQDIFDFLNAWFAGSTTADFNGSGLQVQDIFDFLNSWFAGCP